MRVGPQLEKFQIKAKAKSRLQMLAFKTKWKKKKNTGKSPSGNKHQSFVMLLLPNGKLTKSVEKLLGQSHVV